MVELEHHGDQIDQHDIWTLGDELTADDVEEFRSEMQSMVDNLKDELSSLEDKLQDALSELEDKVPKCAECGDPLESDEDRLCASCEEEVGVEDQGPSRDELEVLWA